MNWALARQLAIIVTVAAIATIYGVFARGHDLFPTGLVLEANKLIYTAVNKAHNKGPASYYYIPATDPHSVTVRKPDRMEPGLTLVSGLGKPEALFARLVDDQGRVEQSWSLDWNRLWPNPTHLKPAARAKANHGVLSLGAVVSENGDLTFNFEQLGMVQLDVCGRVKWRVPKMANHSLFRDEAGNFWTQELVERSTPIDGLPNYKLPFEEHMVMEVSPEGKILKEISVLQLLQRNEYNGLLFMRATDTWSTAVTGDTLHITSINIFPKTTKPGRFKAGDVMLSLNGINTVIVFDPATMVVKASVTGPFLRQSDADFVDGDTISIFDNHNVSPDRMNGSSRVIEHSFKTGEDRVVFKGDASHPFYSAIMGRHQRLPNGNLLLTEGLKGRVIEVDSGGQAVWEYFNVADPHTLAIIEDAQRIPENTLTTEKLKRLQAACHS